MISVVIVSERRKDLELIASSVIGGFQIACSVNCFHDSTEVLPFLEKTGIPVDVFILQINMKKQGGYQLAETIRTFRHRQYADTPILFITPQSYNMVGFPMLAAYRSYRRHNYISMPVTRLDVQGKLGLYFDEILAQHKNPQTFRPVFYFEHDEGIPYEPVYLPALPEISLAWLKQYDILEDLDVEMVNHPEQILDGGGHVLLAVKDALSDGHPAENVLGMVMLENNGDSAEILKLGVRENARGQGIGRALMETVLKIAKEEGKHNLTLSSNHQLTSALRLYESMGFTYTTCDRPHFELSDIYMELLL